MRMRMNATTVTRSVVLSRIFEAVFRSQKSIKTIIIVPISNKMRKNATVLRNKL